MCGIALIVGEGADRATFDRMLGSLAARGEVREELPSSVPHLMAGTQRLRIVDRDRAVQPWVSADGRWVLCYDGEVFNHGELRSELSALGVPFRSESDTEVVLEAFLAWGPSAVARLRGEFAVAIVSRSDGRTFLARDPLGVKPLYWARRAGRLHVASEIKALVPVGARVVEVPPGHYGFAAPGGGPELVPYVDLTRIGADQMPINDPDEAAKLVRAALVDSIRVRVDTDLTVGVTLSGGLDSSITLTQVREMHPDCVAFTIGAPGSPDLEHARRLCADLGVPHEVITMRPSDIRFAQVREAIRLGELTEYGDIINAVVSAPLFRRVRDVGVKVVLTGDGCDELFGGYPMYHTVGTSEARELFLHKIRNLCRTELQRLDRTSMGHGVEARVPFLDTALVELAMRMPLSLKMRSGKEKWIVREAFADVLPDHILNRPKNPMSYASGLHERARLYRARYARAHRSFGYVLHEPLRRDFDAVLAAWGNDLPAALAAGAFLGDYRWWEHGRDLLGALRWFTRDAAPY